MSRMLITLVLVSVLLAACAPAVTPTAAPSPVPGVVATRAAPTAPAATPAPTTALPTQPAASSKVTFKIVPGSKVTYEVAETFLNQNNRLNVAVGVTTDISGEIFADKANPQQSTLGTFNVDVSKFVSDSGQRDNAIRGRWLESSKFPLAKFVPIKIENLPAAYTDGQDYSFKITGDLTVREVTKPVTFDLTARLTGDTLTGKASAVILLSDFGVGPISILGILNTEDQAKITFEFVAKP